MLEIHKADVSEGEMIKESETCNPTMFEYLYITNHGCQISRIKKYGEE